MTAHEMTLVGHLEAELGVGEVARQLVGACDAAGVRVLPVSLPAGASRQGHPFDHAETSAGFGGSVLVCVNADQVANVRAVLGEGLFTARRTIGQWWWEAPVLPAWFGDAFGLVDEVWAGSSWLAEVFRTGAPEGVDVVHVPLAVAGPPLGRGLARADLGLREDTFLVGTAFDHNSVLARKNPLGLIDAYRRAFGPGEGRALVVKSINAAAHPASAAAVRDAAADRDDVLVIDAYMPAADKNALIADCDCWASLHRAEGFGITLAEAMLLETPVMATDWSGNTDFCTAETSWPVPYGMSGIGIGNPPYPAEALWAEPVVDAAAALLRRIAAHPEEARRRAEAARAFVVSRHSPEACGDAIAARLATLASGPPASAPASAIEALLRDRRRVGGPTPRTVRTMDGPEHSRLERAERLLAEAEERLFEAEREAAQAEVARLERDEQRLVADELARRLEVVEADKAELAERVARAARVHSEMQASVSWRVTAPLRSLAARRRG